MSSKYSEEVKEHVRRCSDCVVTQSGDVFLCREGSAINQAELKNRFFGEGKGSSSSVIEWLSSASLKPKKKATG